MIRNLIGITVLCIGMVVHSQAYEGKGDIKINVGISAFGYGSGLSGSVDFGILDWLSVGGGTDLYFSNPEKYKDENFYVYGRANFHVGELIGMSPEWDLYPGVNLGLVGDEFGLGAHVGARYFFNDIWGLFAELGNHGTLGVSLNL